MSALEHIALVSSDRPGSLAGTVARGFEACGVRATIVPYMSWAPRLPQSIAVRGVGRIELLLGALVRVPLEARLVWELGLQSPDAVLFIKADDLHRAAYQAIGAVTGGPLAAFHPDDPFNIGGLFGRGASHPRAAAQAAAVDLNMSWSPAVIERLAARGVATRYIAFSCDPALHPVPALTDEDRAAYGADVTFIGNWDEERERWMTEVAAACERDGVDLALWGTPDWTRVRDERLRRAWRGRPLLGLEMAKATAASKINLNLLRVQNKGATNMRTFEIPCAGGFMLHERSAVLDRHFTVGEACEDFATPEELADKIRRWLAMPAERERIASHGHQAAMAWTYREWAAQVIAWLAPLVETRR